MDREEHFNRINKSICMPAARLKVSSDAPAIDHFAWSVWLARGLKPELHDALSVTLKMELHGENKFKTELAFGS